VRQTPAVLCSYQGGEITCDCENGDAGTRRWRCMDHPPVVCPPFPGNGADCSSYPSAYCVYHADGGAIFSACTCTANGSSQTWRCQ
jgi:hypothetical protein